ncbi:serine hydrolase domain-containing protein [Eudoraea chungangensis]|uniref:serine hydrolase domain-containing protein n=1 Tax=Eudoraea chungangensis TaxID=1481905 RepID=UPI0023EB451A|nr:serine hydrolase domain-containing protein [Eudoraea chungangensis]
MYTGRKACINLKIPGVRISARKDNFLYDLKVIVVFILFLIVSACKNTNKPEHNPATKFTEELTELKDFFKIPGLAISIDQNGETIYSKYLGVADLEKSTKIDATTLFPIASLTKVFSGVLLMKLVEKGRLNLDVPINSFHSESSLGDSILIKHVFSHTSQGKPGQEFLYSSRFGLLTEVIEQAGGMSFSEALREEILDPLQLKNTFLLQDSSQLLQKGPSFAKPYLLDQGIESGFVDFGFSASAGIVSNLEDLAVFNSALDNNLLLSKNSKSTMFSPFAEDLPYGHGIFSQEFLGLNMVWAYGQYDCYSSLILKIPEKNLTLTILANSSLLSDPARLIYGDITSSLFALSFLKNYVCSVEEMTLIEKQLPVAKRSGIDKEFFRKKLLAQALAESYMARYEPERLASSAAILRKVFSAYPDYLTYANLNLLHNLSFLKDVAFFMELGEFKEFDTQLVSIGEKMLAVEADNPYVNIYLGTFYDRNGNMQKARFHFENIINAKNFSNNWYTQEALAWLNTNK